MPREFTIDSVKVVNGRDIQVRFTCAYLIRSGDSALKGVAEPVFARLRQLTGSEPIRVDALRVSLPGQHQNSKVNTRAGLLKALAEPQEMDLEVKSAHCWTPDKGIFSPVSDLPAGHQLYLRVVVRTTLPVTARRLPKFGDAVPGGRGQVDLLEDPHLVRITFRSNAITDAQAKRQVEALIERLRATLR